MQRIGLILLAAGASTRMGSAKQLLPYHGSTLVRRAAEAGLESACRPVIVVVGASAPAVIEALEGLPVTVVENPRWPEGMGTSVQVGVEAARGLSGVLIGLADQPFVTATTYNRLLSAHEATGQPIVAARYEGTVGVPALFSSELFPALLELHPDQGCRGLIRSHRDLVHAIDCPEAAFDLDTPADYRRVVEGRYNVSDECGQQ